MDTVDIVNEKWDYLIVLDACRFDYFAEMYAEYLDGQLAKKKSPGSCTDQWRDNSFPDFYDDIVYITANPMLCSTAKVYGYVAGEHFHRVYEVWRDHWNSEKGTVLPQDLVQAAIDIIPNHPDKRFVIHFIQPHEPYLLPEIESCGWDQGNMYERVLAGWEKYRHFMRVKKFLLGYLKRLFKNTTILTNYPEWVLRQFLFMPPRNAMDALRRRYGKEMLRKAYRANLQYALEQVAVLVGHLAGTIVVTADHGEFLGENRMYAHPCYSEHPTLREIPWLTIEKGQKTVPGSDFRAQPGQKPQQPSPPSDEQQPDITDKLKALGYFE